MSQQSRLGSVAEAIASTAVGFVLSTALGFVVYPAFGYAFTLAENIGITAIYTVVSILRGYAVRRWFNRRHRPAESSAS